MRAKKIRVFYTDDPCEGEIKFGTTDGQISNGGLVVSGDRILNTYCFLDTLENRETFSIFRRKWRAWKMQEPSIAEFLNRMSRPGNAEEAWVEEF